MKNQKDVAKNINKNIREINSINQKLRTSYNKTVLLNLLYPLNKLWKLKKIFAELTNMM